MRTLLLLIWGVFSFSALVAADPISKETLKEVNNAISITAEAEPSTFVNSVNTIYGNLLLPTADLIIPGPTPLPLIRYYNSTIEESKWLHGVGMTCNYPLWIRGIPSSAPTAPIICTYGPEEAPQKPAIDPSQNPFAGCWIVEEPYPTEDDDLTEYEEDNGLPPGIVSYAPSHHHSRDRKKEAQEAAKLREHERAKEKARQEEAAKAKKREAQKEAARKKLEAKLRKAEAQRVECERKREDAFYREAIKREAKRSKQTREQKHNDKKRQAQEEDKKKEAQKEDKRKNERFKESEKAKHHHETYHREDPNFIYALAEEDGGSIVKCAARPKSKELVFYLDPETVHQGLTNTGSGEISARTNLKNIRFNATLCNERLNKHTDWIVDLSNGGERSYKPGLEFCWTRYLTQEIKPSGNRLLFHYYTDRKWGPALKEIRAVSRNKIASFGRINIDYNGSHKKVQIEASNGKKATYTYDYYSIGKTRKAPFITEVTSTDQPDTQYEYTRYGKHQLLSKIKRPDGRYLKIYYDDKRRVIEQRAPIGHNDNEAIQYRFKYHPDDYTTYVFDALDNKRIYHYSSHKRLKSIEYYESDKTFLCAKKFFWGDREHITRGERDTSDEGHLLAKSIKGSNGTLSSITYEYDDFGNITEEKRYGNFTGKSLDPFSLSDDGKPKTKVESYTTKRSYNTDRFHMVRKVSEEDGPTYTYQYKSDTDLLTAKFTEANSHIKIREFFEYDYDAVLVKKILDDGSKEDPKDLADVTERHITYITPVRDREDHGIGQPKEIKECYLSSGQETLLKRTEYEYDKESHVTKEILFDENNQEQYFISYTYDDKGQLTKKTHSAGKKYHYEYDKNGNKTREELVGADYHTKYSYDAMNRLKCETVCHHNGPTFTTTYTYDKTGNKISMVDRFGQETTYKYDGLNRLTSVRHPAMKRIDGDFSPKEKFEYDALNSITSSTDCEDLVTTYRRTSRGQPTLIMYPDGSTELFFYNLNGTLSSKTDRNHLGTRYEYDFLHRVRSVTVGSEKTTTHTYSSFHETSVTDPMGRTTHYHYDGAGRLIEEKKNGKRTQYEYDSLGRRTLIRECEEKGSYIATLLDYDLFDREVARRTVHSDGMLLSHETYVYDTLDNKIAVTQHINEKTSSTDRTTYNSLSLPTVHMDALGNITRYEYDYAWENKLKQKVFRKTTIDPLGNSQIEIFDAYNRIDTLVKRDAKKDVLAKTVFWYDGNGNKTRQQEFVYVDGSATREYTIEWTYTPADLVETCTEQPGTKEAKQTRYTYTPGGLVDTITKPDGTILYHTYDRLLRLQSLLSSDSTVHYSYTYDLNDNVLSVRDEHLNMTHTKTYDNHNRVITDTIGTGVSSTFSYDALDRVTSFTTEGRRVEYGYGSGALRSIIRKDPSGQVLYTHRYDFFDFRGHVTLSSLIGACGTLQPSWDILGRPTSISAPHFEESGFQYDDVGNLTKVSRTDDTGHFDSTYTYDALYQLKSEQGLFNEKYKNDSLHNRIKKSGESYKVNKLNQFLSDSQTSFTYDKNGNPIEMVFGDYITKCTYDALDRLIAEERLLRERRKISEEFDATMLTGNAVKLKRTEYAYDASHRRIFKKSFRWENEGWHGGERYKYLYFNAREVGSIGSDGVAREFRVLGLGHGAELGASVALELNGKTYCPLHDHRGNICVLLDSQNGASEETYRYSAFGEEESGTHRLSPWRFASKRFDPETGFVFFGRRYYSPRLGRFLTPDPTGFADCPNLYAYVRNNPLTWHDLFGLAETSEGSFWSSFGEGCARGLVETYLSDAMKFTCSYNRNDPPTIQSNGVISLSLNVHGLTREYEEPSVGFVIAQNLGQFCKTNHDKDLKHHVGCYWNGMSTRKDEAYRAAASIKEAGGKDCLDVLVCFNPSYGFCFDVVECLCQFYGIKTGVDRQLGAKMNEVHKEFTKAGITAKLEQLGHSQGSMTCHNALASSSLQKAGENDVSTGRTFTLGSPCQYAGAINYVAREDKIPEFGRYQRGPSGEVIPCGKPQADRFAAHSIEGEAYQEALSDAVKNRGLFSD